MTITSTPPATHAAPAWLRALVDAHTELVELTGWPLTVEVRARRLVLTTGGALHAITMPAGLAEPVLAGLRAAAGPGPVIAGPGATWWTFLTRPATTPRPVVPADLHGRRVLLAPSGARVVVPADRYPTARFATGRSGSGPWSWIVSPYQRPALPALSTVLAAARRVAGG